MRYLINGDDLDGVVEYLYKQDSSEADYFLETLLVQMYDTVEEGFAFMKELYGNRKG